ncbi:MAG: (2Fe-2S)-binding protein, partial [Spirochaetaceae bacterium]|nr:(2Fe-2S)-binding protein [Spirochaetaceae bacterium]
MSDRGMRVEVDGTAVVLEPGASILDACAAAGRRVPTLCHMQDVSS